MSEDHTVQRSNIMHFLNTVTFKTKVIKGAKSLNFTQIPLLLTEISQEWLKTSKTQKKYKRDKKGH